MPLQTIEVTIVDVDKYEEIRYAASLSEAYDIANDAAKDIDTLYAIVHGEAHGGKDDKIHGDFSRNGTFGEATMNTDFGYAN